MASAEDRMKNLFEAGRVLLYDLASTIFFFILFKLTNDLMVSVAIGMAIGLAQISWQLFHKKPVETLQWISVALVLASGTTTLLTNDPRFMMWKPSVIYVIVGTAMLKRGWMNRYLPPRAAGVVDVAETFGYVWAGMMYFTAALNLVLAYTLDIGGWAAAMSAWAPLSKIGLFLIQYRVMYVIGRRRAMAAGGVPPTQGSSDRATPVAQS
jgi:intracellular septation protein